MSHLREFGPLDSLMEEEGGGSTEETGDVPRRAGRTHRRAASFNTPMPTSSGVEANGAGTGSPKGNTLPARIRPQSSLRRTSTIRRDGRPGSTLRRTYSRYRPGDGIAIDVISETVSEGVQKVSDSTRRWLPWFPDVKKRLKLGSGRFTHGFEWRSKKDESFEARFLPVGNHFKQEIMMAAGVRTAAAASSGSGGDGPSRKVETEFPNNYTHTSKYTVFTFVPMNLLEQFRRVANFYFLVSFVLTLALPDSPVDPMSWVWSLLFVVLVTMIKQGYEDVLRHRSDRTANERIVNVVSDGALVETESQYLEVGDVIRLLEDEAVPCDLVVLSTSHEQGQCYVQTANLDGETNLKTKQSATVTKGRIKEARDVSDFVGYVECELPNPKLDSFVGRLVRMRTIGGRYKDVDKCALSQENVLHSGTTVKNTKEVFAVCVYSGSETKMSLNSKLSSIKFSTIERSLNKFLLYFLALLLVEMTFSMMMSLALGIEFVSDGLLDIAPGGWHSIHYHWYLGVYYSRSFGTGLGYFLVWMVIYNYIIPIALFVALEVQKFLSSKFFPWDLALYDAGRDLPAKCNTSDINEELGLVTHLFSDKTGTLTQNVMVFRKYSRDGQAFEQRQFAEERWDALILVMVLCHSVQVGDSGEFVASSPDEKALLEACRDAGFDFLGSTLDGEMSVKIKTGQVLQFQKLCELEFDSFRKCMSVLVRDISTGIVHVVSKGAETAMLPKCASGPVDETATVVDSFAAEGLRTLVFGHKVIGDSEYEDFQRSLDTAKQSMVDREEKVREAYGEIEEKFHLVGATGIEDLLQEDVVDTISKVRQAGIIAWMLTGDKKETAITLGQACGLLTRKDELIDLCASTKDTAILLDETHSKLINSESREERDKDVNLVVDGKALNTIMSDVYGEELKWKLSEIGECCSTVIACRLSPIQKSQLVRMVKEADPDLNLTAAIGDGGNDVSMIQEANLGIGIIGVEGDAAAKSADFAFSKFKHLQRALFVHGHWYYRRLSALVLYSFYKNIASFTCQFFFAIHSNWSGISMYDDLYLIMFNALYTNFPIIVYGLCEQNLSEETLLSRPELYRRNRHNRSMRFRELSKWVMLGFWHSAVCFYFTYFLWQPSFGQFGDDLRAFGSVVGFNVVLVANLKLVLSSSHWSPHLLLTIGLSVLSYFFCVLLLQQWYIVDGAFIANAHTFRTWSNALSHFPTWAVIPVVTVTALLPDIMERIVQDYNVLAATTTGDRARRLWDKIGCFPCCC